MDKSSDRLSKTAVDILARCIIRNHLYCTREETDEWLKTEDGARIQELINTIKNRGEENGNL